MANQQLLYIDRATGELVSTQWTVASSTPFEQRAGALVANAVALMGGAPKGDLYVRCDGCGRQASVGVLAPTLPPRWKTTADGDLCSVCATI